MKLNNQIHNRRKELGLTQADMKMRIGMNQQQFQRIEAGGNVTLENVERIAEGLNAELVLVPKDKLQQVYALLETPSTQQPPPPYESNVTDPWADLFDEDQP